MARHSEGLSHGAVYHGATVEPWIGLISVAASSAGGSELQYLDGVVHAVYTPNEDYTFTVEGYTYPELLDTVWQLDGFTYQDSNYLYLIYNPVLYLETKAYASDADTTAAVTFAFDATAKPIQENQWNISRLLVDLDGPQAPLAELIKILHGTEDADPRWPTVSEVEELFESATTLRIIDHRDGTWSAIGPDSAIKMVSSSEFEITWPSAKFIDTDTFRISSL